MFTFNASPTRRVARGRMAAAVSMAGAIAAVGVVATAAPAHAAPTKNGEFTLTCDNGESYTAVTPPGEGAFTPAMATDGTRLVPVAFGESTFELTENGVVIESGTEPGSAKGSAAKSPRPTSECTFSSTFSFTEGGNEYVGTFAGSVTAMIVPPTMA
jgi:hypothetical protein